MISVEQALASLFRLVSALPVENLSLHQAAGRVLAGPVTALRDQPPFAASAMDGYAVRGAEVQDNATWTVVGESAAGHGYKGTVAPGQALRIFTGAPLPDDLDHVVIQENVVALNDIITLNDGPNTNAYVRPKGADFAQGATLDFPRRLRPADIALLAAMNVASVPVTRRPAVAIIPTGDELVQPGETPGPDQIIASNSFGLAAMLEDAGADVQLLPIARDRASALTTVLGMAQGADLIVTIGGASVGDHDLVGATAIEMGLDQEFYKVAMRPGKPLMAGRIGASALVGLPGNPVSAMVCGEVFLKPMIDILLGLPAQPRMQQTAKLTHDMPPNGPREHYMRATVVEDEITVAPKQDSALLTVLQTANALAIRPAHQEQLFKGATLNFITI